MFDPEVINGSDIGSVAGSDTGSDAASDVGSDAGIDVGIDAGNDVGSDSGSDVGSDVAIIDADEVGGKDVRESEPFEALCRLFLIDGEAERAEKKEVGSV